MHRRLYVVLTPGVCRINAMNRHPHIFVFGHAGGRYAKGAANGSLGLLLHSFTFIRSPFTISKTALLEL
jgi:hypothetical protein